MSEKEKVSWRSSSHIEPTRSVGSTMPSVAAAEPTYTERAGSQNKMEDKT